MHPFAALLIVFAILAQPPNHPRDNGDSSDTGGRTTTRYDDGTLTIEASTPGSLKLTRTPGLRRSGVVIRCAYYDIKGTTLGTLRVFRVVPYRRQEPFLLTCWHPTADPTDQWTRVLPLYPKWKRWTGRAPAGLVTDVEVARYASNSIVFEPPTLELSPTPQQVVGVPTWLAVTSKLHYASASAQAGKVWATVQPRFSHATWRFGNGDQKTCSADVTKTWKPHLSADVQSSNCRYTFEENGDGRPLVGSVSVTWRVRFTSRETGGRGQALPSITLTKPVVFNVRELQAVID